MRFLAFSSLVLLSTPVLAQGACVAEVEPNDTPATAQAVALGNEVVPATLVAGESDWYSFTTGTGGQHRFTINGTTDTKLELVDSLGTTIIAANDDSRGLQSDITINVAAGSYFLRVFGFSATTTGAYSLDVSLANSRKLFNAFEAEPNDLITDTGVFALGTNDQVSGALGSATDIDLYRVVLTAARTGLWFQVTEGDTPWTSQHRIEFYDSTGALLTPTATLGVNAADSGTFSFRNSQIRVWPAGTYYVGVRNRLFVPTYNPVPLGNYRLELLQIPLNTGAVVAEPDAVGVNTNGTFATATPLALGAQGRGHITNVAPGTDPNDFWGPFAITAGQTWLFQTGQLAGGPSGTPLLDSTIRLHQLDTCTNTLVTPPSTITTGNILDPTSHGRGVFTFFVTGTFYLEVVSPGTLASQTGDYVLEVSPLQSAPYMAATYAIIAANAACGVAPIPTLTRSFTNEVPTKGDVFVRRITNLDPGTFGVLAYNVNPACPLNTIPGPFGVTPLTCFLNIDPVGIAFDLGPQTSAGVFERKLLIPSVRSLRGAILWEQAAELDLFSFTVQWGNYARLIVGDRSY